MYCCVFSGGCDSRPKEIANGMAIYRGLKFGDRVRYICNAGHKLIGDKYLTCEGGNWKGRLPECKAGELSVLSFLPILTLLKYAYR